MLILVYVVQLSSILLLHRVIRWFACFDVHRRSSLPCRLLQLLMRVIGVSQLTGGAETR
jgi:hypothetical protein